MNKVKQKKSPWPTKEVMTQIYDLNLWGGKKNVFYSGEGSHRSEIINPYIELVKNFLTSFKRPIIVCDLGCGDFNVGKELVTYAKKYIAIDVVQRLIAHNKEQYKAANLEFQCLDIVADDIPMGNCAIVRQVFQHLSNTEIQCVLTKLKNFEYVILSEHIPERDFNPNIDIISGQGIRLKKQSGVDITAAPFNFLVKNEKQVLSFHYSDGKSKILTTIYAI